MVNERDKISLRSSKFIKPCNAFPHARQFVVVGSNVKNAMDDFFFINNKQLIAEVKKRPELYDASYLNFYNLNNRDEKWIELFQVLVPQWYKLSAIEQQSYGLTIKKKWRSMRDSFARDIRKRSNPSNVNKPRRYIYYNQMKFLLTPASKQLQTPDGTITNTSPTDPLQDDNGSSVESENDAGDETQHADNSFPIPDSSKDEDKMFLLSLLPLYKTMKKDSKLVGRIKILEALRNVIQEDCNSVRSDNNPKGKDVDHTAITSGDSEEMPNHETAYYEGNVLNSPNFSSESALKCEQTYQLLIGAEDDPLLTLNEDSSHLPIKKLRVDHHNNTQNSSPAVSPAPSTTSTSDDIFEAIGKNVAHKLRRMVQQQRIIAEKIVGDVMYQGQLKMLTVNSHLAVDN